jgi:hypothetical protein
MDVQTSMALARDKATPITLEVERPVALGAVDTGGKPTRCAAGDIVFELGLGRGFQWRLGFADQSRSRVARGSQKQDACVDHRGVAARRVRAAVQALTRVSEYR